MPVTTQVREIDPRSDGAEATPLRASSAPGGLADRFLLRLEPIADGRIRVRATGPAGTAEAVVPRPDPFAATPDGDLTDPWERDRRVGIALHATAFPPPIRRLLEESRLRRDEAPLPIALEAADPELARLPWELLRDPETDRFLALTERTPLSRLVPRRETGDARTTPAPRPRRRHPEGTRPAPSA